MDKYKALELEKKLQGKKFKEFEVIEFINNGKSAAVFKAKNKDKFYALKIFDNELIERFGHEVQTKRIEQEISLKGHNINHLVKIIDGDNIKIAGIKYYFIIMEFVEGDNLKDFIKKKEYDEKFVLNVIDKLYHTTEQLLNERQIAHRDIKPENIMIREDGEIILMDLGVLKFVGTKSFSDEEERSFVGTLRYAAPEFLLRTESDSIEGWRAINYYQIGATVHDLIMKKELFEEKTPYSNLVIAIKDDLPKISNTNYSFQLLQLTRDMLSKDWKLRLNLVNKERITKVLESNNLNANSPESELDKLLKLRINNQARFDEIDKLQRSKQELNKRKNEIGNKLVREIDLCFNYLKNNGVCNQVVKSEVFRFKSDTRIIGRLTQNYLYELSGDLKIGFPRKLYILVRLSNDEKYNTEINLWGIWPTGFTKLNISNPSNFFKYLKRENGQADHTLNTINIFSGILAIDESFSQYLRSKMVKFMTKALKLVEKIVDEEIKWQEEIANSNQRTMSRISYGYKDVIVDKLLEMPADKIFYD